MPKTIFRYDKNLLSYYNLKKEYAVPPPPPKIYPTILFFRNQTAWQFFFFSVLFFRKAYVLLKHNAWSCQKSYDFRILVLGLSTTLKATKKSITSHFVTSQSSFVAVLVTGYSFALFFFYLICSCHLVKPICNITENGATNKTLFLRNISKGGKSLYF